MIVYFDIPKVTIVTGRGTDKVYLHTTEDSPYPGLTKEPLVLDFGVVAGDGYRYITEVLKIDHKCVEVIQA